MIISIGLFIAALVLFIIHASGAVQTGKINLQSAGLACWVLGVILSGLLK